jgi:hypothetical protein
MDAKLNTTLEAEQSDRVHGGCVRSLGTHSTLAVQTVESESVLGTTVAGFGLLVGDDGIDCSCVPAIDSPAGSRRCAA